ncbi:MAG: hypothetical protein PHW73_00920 [Atribacterota bacterium]|nr:hypothetical protein [Atribacterota bacterium]
MLANQVGLSDKYVSERHAIASQSKFTAGEASKILKKQGINYSAKEVIKAYKLFHGYEPEWHHAGFYKNNGKSTMGRTFFFTESEIEEISTHQDEINQKFAQEIAENQKKSETIIIGFYYIWDYDYSGNYGKKRNHKVLAVYEGNELNIPKNFTSCNQLQFENAKSKVGRKYYGWDEPLISEFS